MRPNPGTAFLRTVAHRALLILALLLVSGAALAQTADLALSKAVSNAAPNVGDTITFTVTLTNNGPNQATNAAVQDLLPAGLVFVTSTPSQGTYTPGTGTWSVGTVNPGTPQTLTIQATVASPSPQTNTATISASDQADPTPANNSASASLTPLQADLTLVKTVDNPTPNVGDVITFTITLNHNGPDPATNVAVQDLLPAGLTFVSATPSQGTYTPATGAWSVGAMNPGTSNTLLIQATVVSASPQVNTATISHSDQFDPDPTSNTASAAVTPQRADLALTKIVSNAAPTVGSTITFTITLTDNGPDPATNVAVQDLLPAGLTFVSATPSQGTYNNATGSWIVGTVSPGTPQTLLINAVVAGAANITNTATISASDQFDPNTANNSASATESSLPPTDLGLTQSVSNAAPNVGDTITFTVTLSNGGPATATNVTVQDLLPAGLVLVTATPSQGTYTAGTGTWTVGTVATAATATLTLQATVASPNPQTNTATIAHSDAPDPNPANNSATATVTPQQADLRVTKTVSNATPTVGSTVTFTVTVTDLGPNPATNVAVQDALPAGLTFVAATPSQGSYSNATGAWTVGTVATATPATLAVQATVVGASAATNTATITHSDQFDPATANNSASATETPGLAADLAVSMTASTTAAAPGATFTWTVTVTNNGPSTATNVAVQDALPAGVTFVSATPSQGTYTSGTGAWTIGTLANGSSATLVLTVTAGSSSVTNTASISHSDQPDPNAANSSASLLVTIGGGALPAVPTLSPLMLLLLASMLLALAVAGMRRRR